ncbi:hypothetical protein Tco_0540778 [Tanacetum coccineum]
MTLRYTLAHSHANTRQSYVLAHENGAVLDEEKGDEGAQGGGKCCSCRRIQVTILMMMWYDLPLNVDHVFEMFKCDGIRSDVYEAPTLSHVMANLTLKKPGHLWTRILRFSTRS